MSNPFKIVEEGDIQCEHGGKVVLISSVTGEVIGGKKPLITLDLLGAVIQGCTYNISIGGHCTCVASISSAITEDNVGRGEKNFLLRVDGCQTNNGSALVLIDPGQDNTKVSPKAGVESAVSILAKELEGAKVDTKENITKEKYRIYPLRKSNKQLRGLRGARDFQLLKNFHYTDNYTHERIIPQTEAYIYLTFDNKTTEYKVINRGNFFNPTIQQVQFKDENGTLRKHLPFYEEAGEVKLVYSNIKLSTADLSNFTPTLINIGSSKNPHIQHHKVHSKAVRYDEKTFEKEKLISQEEAKKRSSSHINILGYIDDPIGEVEDLYHEYEFSYHFHYGVNRPLINDLREKNHYSIHS